MAVQIPMLRRGEAPAPESVGRIDAVAPDAGSKVVGAITNTLAEGVVEVGKYLDNKEKDLAHTEALRASTEYEQWADRRLEGDSQNNVLGLRHVKGDPTPHYNQFDTESAERLKEIHERYKDASPIVKGAVGNALVNKHNSVYGKRLTAYGQQYSVYEQQVTEDAINLEIKNAGDSIALIDPKSPSTLASFNSNVGNIEQILARHSVKNGMGEITTPDQANTAYFEGGQVVYVKANDMIRSKQAADVSKATYQAIDSLLKSNKPDAAKFMMDTYSKRLDPVNRAKLDEAFVKVDTEVKAYNALNKLEDLTYPEQKKQIKALPEKTAQDMKIKQEALQMLDANKRYKDNLQKRDSEEVANKLIIATQKKMESDTPYDSLYQLQQDPQYKNLIDRVTDPKQRKALHELVEKPDKSDEEAYAKLMTATVEGRLYGMSYPEFAQAKAGLNEQDAKQFDRWYKEANLETESQERAKANAIGTNFTNQLVNSGVFKKVKGQLTPKDQVLLAQAQTELKSAMDKLPKNTTIAEGNEFVKQFVAKKVYEIKKSKSGLKDKIREFFGFGGPAEEAPPEPQPVRSKGVQRGGVPMTSTPTSEAKEAAPVVKVKKSFKDLSKAEQDKAMSDFKAAKGRKWKDASELMDWLNSGKK